MVGDKKPFFFRMVSVAVHKTASQTSIENARCIYCSFWFIVNAAEIRTSLFLVFPSMMKQPSILVEHYPLCTWWKSGSPFLGKFPYESYVNSTYIHIRSDAPVILFFIINLMSIIVYWFVQDMLAKVMMPLV
jgi:hypothetical protein